jgi:c-di-AMP phosphodiesterase-like protein
MKKHIKKIIATATLIIIILLIMKCGAIIQENKDNKEINILNDTITALNTKVEELNNDNTTSNLEVEDLKGQIEECKQELLKKN